MTQNRPLRIAMLGHKRMPSREGGVEIVVEELSTRMAQLGYEVTCYNRSGHHVCGKEFDAEKRECYKGVRLKTVKTLDRKGLAAVTSSFSAALCAALGRYDVVHFHAEGPCAMLWLPKLLGKRCIVTIHGLDWQRAKWKQGLGATYIRFGEKMAARFADEIIVLSRDTQTYFQRRYGRHTVLIPNGVTRPQPAAPCRIREMFGLEKDAYLLYLGRLVPEKGVHYLIEAFRGVHTEKALVIAGGPSDTGGYVRTLRASAQGDPRILFTGFVQGRLLEELYSNAYAYILPSDLEGMPLSLLEAMSYGACCLVSDITECTQVVGVHGAVFKQGSVADLRRQIQLLCDSPERVQSIRRFASDYICQTYNWDQVVAQTLELYHGVKPSPDMERNKR